MLSWKDKKIDKNLSRAKVLRNFFTYGALFAALGAMAFFGVCSPNQGGSGLGGPAASVAGDEISYPEFRRTYESTLDRYQRAYSGNFNPATMGLARMVLNQLIEQRVVYGQAVENGMTVSDLTIEDEIIDMFKDEKTGKFSEERFNNLLRYYGFTESDFEKQLRRDLTINRYRQFVGETNYVSENSVELDFKISETKLNLSFIKFDNSNVKAAVTKEDREAFMNEEGDKKILEYFEKNANEFNSPEKVSARHILVSYKEARRAPKEVESRSKEQANKRAQEILKKVKSNGSDFVAIANAETDESSGKTKGGDLGFFRYEDMAKEFSEVAFNLKPGEISGVVESPFGFHIIKVEAIKPAIKSELSDVRIEIANKLILKEKTPKAVEEKANQVLEALKKNPALDVASLGFKWEESGEFSADASSIPKLGSDSEVISSVFGLEKKGDIADKVISSAGAKYIIQLKSIQKGNSSILQNDKRQELAKNSAYRNALSVFNAIKEEFEADLKTKGQIEMNEKYLAIDQTQNQEGT